MDEQYDPQMRYTKPETEVVYNNVAFKDMDFSDPFKELPKALSAVKKEMNTTVAKDATNPHFGKKYSTLDASLDAASQILGSHGLAVVQMPTDDILYTMMTHSSGEYIRFAYKMEIKEQTAQGRGSALTYAREIPGAVHHELSDSGAFPFVETSTTYYQLVKSALIYP